MITEVLTPTEFSRSGLNLLNLAWSIGMDIVSDFNNAELDTWDSDGEVTDEYWRESQPALGNALALVQQAQEMALKGKIAAVSPYLLIGRDPREWPSRCEREDTPFSKFRTADAADLIKIHNTVCAPQSRLGQDFSIFFDKIRRQRNAIIHVGSTGRRLDVVDLFLGVLQTNEYLYSDIRWMKRRLEYLESDRISVAHSSDHVGHDILMEFETAARLLKPADTRQLLGLTKARRYLCPPCHDWASELSSELVRTALLVPNKPSANVVTCLVCGESTSITRGSCITTGCKSNVICANPRWGSICLTCGADPRKLK